MINYNKGEGEEPCRIQSVEFLGTFESIPNFTFRAFIVNYFFLFEMQYCNYFPQKSHSLVSAPD